MPEPARTVVDDHRRWSMLAVVLVLVLSGVLVGGLVGVIATRMILVVLDHITAAGHTRG